MKDKLWLGQDLIWQEDNSAGICSNDGFYLTRLIEAETKEDAKKYYDALVNKFTIQGSVYPNAVSAIRLVKMLLHKISDHARVYILDLLQDMFVESDIEFHSISGENLKVMRKEFVGLFDYFAYYFQYGNPEEQEIVILLLSYCGDFDESLVVKIKKLYKEYEKKFPEGPFLELLKDCRNEL